MKKYSFNTGWTYSGQKVTLPHDAMIRCTRAPENPGGSGQAFFPGVKGEYRRTFPLPAEWSGKPVKLQFEGVYKNSEVTVNGEKKGGTAYGYIPFYVDCGILPDGENTITVSFDNGAQPDSRWYSGAGIYRPVWAWVGEGIVEEDVKIKTLSIAPAVIRVTVAGQAVEAEIFDGEEKVASGCGEITVPDAKLWSAETPHLYTCKAADQEVKFGIRTLSWSNKGFFVNGQETLLRGGCIHHDNGILGAATYDESEWRRIRMMKEAGYNAIRASHNPSSRAILEACDFYGMYVMDEGWDMWFNHKCPHDYATQWRENHLSDLKAMVERDYNHPSVIMYSIGNEVSEPAQPEGVAATREMVEYLHSLDDSRPVTGGINLMIISRSAKGNAIYDAENGGTNEDTSGGMGSMNSYMFNVLTTMVGTSMNKAANSKKADQVTSPCLDALDIAGYNYASGRYPLEGKAHPDRIVFGSETFPQDIYKNWEMVKKYPYLIGDFMWTSWDYLGETGAGAWAYSGDGKGFSKPYPWILADMGTLDILGNPGGEAFWAAAVWGELDNPKIAVRPVNHPGVMPAKSSWRGTNAIPSWSWQGCEGNKAVIEVYFDCARVELKLNGKSLGKKKMKECRAIFKTKYAPGKLEAIAYDASGKELGRRILESASRADITAAPEKSTAKAGEIVYIPISVGDGAIVESNADKTITVTVRNGELLAFGSANPRTEEQYHTGTFTTYYGHALAVVKATQPGKLTLCVDGKEAAAVTVTE